MDFQECDPTVRAYYHIHIYIFRYDAVLGGEWAGTLLEYNPKRFCMVVSGRREAKIIYSGHRYYLAVLFIPRMMAKERREKNKYFEACEYIFS